MNSLSRLSFSWSPLIFTYLYFTYSLAYISFHLFLLCPFFVGFNLLFSSQAVLLHEINNIFTFLWNIKILLNPTHLLNFSMSYKYYWDSLDRYHCQWAIVCADCAGSVFTPRYRWREEAELWTEPTHIRPPTLPSLLLPAWIQKSFRVNIFQ